MSDEFLNVRCSEAMKSSLKSLAAEHNVPLSDVVKTFLLKGVIEREPVEKSKKAKVLEGELASLIVKSARRSAEDFEGRGEAMAEAWQQLLKIANGDEAEARQLLLEGIGRRR